RRAGSRIDDDTARTARRASIGRRQRAAHQPPPAALGEPGLPGAAALAGPRRPHGSARRPLPAARPHRQRIAVGAERIVRRGRPVTAAVSAAVSRRDLRLASRRRIEALLPVGFFIVAASLFPLGVGPEPQVLRQIAPGVVWVCALLAALLSM